MDPHAQSPSSAPITVGEVDRLAEQAFGDVRPVRGVLHVLAGWRGPAECLVAVRETHELPPSDLRRMLWALGRARSDAWVVEADALDEAEARRQGFEEVPGFDGGLGVDGGPSGRALAAWRRSRLAKSKPAVRLVLAAHGEVDFDHSFFATTDRTVVLVGGDPWALESRAADRGVEVVGVSRPSVAQAVGFLRREFGASGVLLEVAPDGLGTLATDPGVDELLLSVCEAPQLPVSAEGPWVIPFADLAERFAVRQERFAGAGSEATWSHHHWSRITGA